jgi:uncharacterized protein (TIGR03083 family)
VTAVSASKGELRRLHDEENADFSAYLHTLSEADWEQPSLCEGWRVRDVVGHILDGNELRLLTLPVRLARYGFSSNKSGRAFSIARAEGRTPAQLLAEFDARDAWAGTCRIFPPRVVLLDRLVHHQDIRRALGHHRVIPADRLLATLDGAPRLGNVLGARKRSGGFAFRADDVEWGWGEGPVVEGPGEAILLSLLGRRQPLGELRGAGAEAFAARVRETQPTTA